MLLVFCWFQLCLTKLLVDVVEKILGPLVHGQPGSDNISRLYRQVQELLRQIRLVDVKLPAVMAKDELRYLDKLVTAASIFNDI